MSVPENTKNAVHVAGATVGIIGIDRPAGDTEVPYREPSILAGIAATTELREDER